MFGIGGTELLVIIVVVLIVFGPKELPAAMRSAGSFMRAFNRLTGDYRRQFDRALGDIERELEIKETRNSVQALIKNPPTSVKSSSGQREPDRNSMTSSDQTNLESGEPTNTEGKES